jgi:hypothetical protein
MEITTIRIHDLDPKTLHLLEVILTSGDADYTIGIDINPAVTSIAGRRSRRSA